MADSRASQKPAPLALTMGEPGGIGGEIALSAWRQRGNLPSFFLIDDPARLAGIIEELDLKVPLRTIDDPAEVNELFAAVLPVLPLQMTVKATPGKADPKNASAITASIERAVALVQEGAAGGLVTNPIQKESLYEAGFGHPGHTEFLAELAGLESAPIMMLVGGGLRTVPVTIHVGLADAIASLTTEAIVHAGRVTAAALARDFGISAPRLAISGLNPHAGEGGALGQEEAAIIAPAVETLRAEGLAVEGPAPADTLFHEAARTRYDAALCMYHDQALIPVKTLDFSGGVNATLGLPFVRTSPDHGTGLDIAGTGRANPTSLCSALTLAGKMATRRIAAQETA